MNRKDAIATIAILVFLSAFLAPNCQYSAAAQVPIGEIPREQIIETEKAAEGPPTDFNPLLFATYYEEVKDLVYEHLAYRDMLSGKLKPWLAESWGWVDDYTFEIKLRPEPRFRDGSPVTADDVIFSFETLAKPIVGELTTLMETIVESIEKIDDRTVHIYLKKDYPHYAQILTILEERIIPKKRWSSLLEEYGDLSLIHI